MVRKSRFLPAIRAAVLAFALVAAARADVIVLKNGGRITGSILREDDKSYVISTGASELVIEKSTVASVERGAATEYVIARGKKALSNAEDALEKKDAASALHIIESMNSELDQLVAKSPDAAKDVAELRKQLDAVRQKSLPADPKAQYAEKRFQDALLALDHVNYREAFDDLQDAAKSDPQRADIMFRLGSVAQNVGDPQASIDAYREVLRLNAEAYYDQVSKPLLTQLQSRGAKLLNERHADAAVEVYSEILMLRGGAEGEPATMADFLARRATRSAENQEDKLMEVYRYADHADLVDLAFAAAIQVQKINPAHENIGDFVAQSGFLAKFRQALDSKNVEEAARLVEAADPSVVNAPSVAARIQKFSGELGSAVRAQMKLEEAKTAFKSADYATAATDARAVMVDFAAEEPAKEAATLLASAEFEAPIKAAIAEASALIDNAKDAEALKLLTDLKANTPKIEDSVQHGKLETLLTVIPLQQRADELWTLAAADMDREDFAAATKRLEELQTGYADTRSGRKAAAWLQQHREALARQADRYKPVDTDYFAAWTDPNFWRAASVPDSAKGFRAAPVISSARGAAMRAFDNVMSADLGTKIDARSPLLLVGAPLAVGGLALPINNSRGHL